MKRIQWHYFDNAASAWVGPLPEAELDALAEAGRIEPHTQVISDQMLQRSPKARPIQYSAIVRLNVEFAPFVDDFHSGRRECPVTVLSGPNNGGKSLLLKQLLAEIGHQGRLIQCNRFSQIDVLNTRKTDEQEQWQLFDSFMQRLLTSHQNSEDNDVKLEQIITGLRDGPRDRMFSLAEELLGNQISLKRVDPENTFSPFYVDMDGENIRYGSSGTRLLLTLLGALFDERFSIFLIDEPEIGLSPRIQAFLAGFLYSDEKRRQYCPHIHQLYVATHSHVFLDRRVFSNNHVVTKRGKHVSVSQVRSVEGFHQLQFTMLGNELELLYLPAAIVLVEGDSDVTFVSKVLQLQIPNRRIAVVRAGGDGEMYNKLHVLGEAFGDLASSPYRDRLFVVLDQRHGVSARRLETLGVRTSHITV